MYNSALSSRERPPGSMIAQRGPGGRPLPGWIQAYLNPMGRGPGGFEPDGRGPGEPGRDPGEARALDGRGVGGRGSDGRGPEGRGGGGRGSGGRGIGGRGPENRDGTGRPPNGRRHGRDMESGGNRKLGRLTNHYSNEAIKILDALIVEDPANVEFRSVRANCYCSLASALIEPDPRQARVMRDRAIEELESLIEQDPENSSYRYRLAMAFSLGNVANSSKIELKMLDKSVEIANELKEQFPKVLDYHYLYGSVRNKQAGQLIKGGELEAAPESVKMAKTTFEYVTKLSPTDRTYRITQFVLAMQLRALITASENANNIVVTQSAKEMLYQLRPGSGMRPPRRGPIN
jgi:hypothetical protein